MGTAAAREIVRMKTNKSINGLLLGIGGTSLSFAV